MLTKMFKLIKPLLKILKSGIKIKKEIFSFCTTLKLMLQSFKMLNVMLKCVENVTKFFEMLLMLYSLKLSACNYMFWIL